MDDETEFAFRCRVLGSGPAVPVRITARRGDRLGAVAADLAAAAGEEAAEIAWSCGGHALDDDAVLGIPPLLEGCTVTLTTAGHAAATPAATTGRRAGVRAQHRRLLEVRVVAGPDAGPAVPLGTEPLVVGRGRGAGVELDDPAVSRRHLELRSAVPGRYEGLDLRESRDDDAPVAFVRDLGSTNGTIVLGRGGRVELRASEHPLHEGDVLVLGDSRLTVSAAPAEPALTAPDGTGGLLVTRSAHLRARTADPVVIVPPSAEPPPRTRFPWLQIVLPVVVSVPMALVWRQPVLLFVALASPAFFLIQFLWEARGRRRDDARQHAARDAAEKAARERLAHLLTMERHELDAWHPDPAAIARIAGAPATTPTIGASPGPPRPGRALWRRTPQDDGWLSVRLGLGRRRSRVRVEPLDPLREPERLDGAPVTLDLGSVTMLGICGPADAVRGLARSIVAQLAGLCAPGDLELAFRPDAAPVPVEERWSWFGWLPHAAGTTTGARSTDARVRVVVVDAIDASYPPAPDTSGSGTVVVQLGSGPSSLPVGCTATIEIDPSGARATLSVQGEEPTDVWVPDRVSSRVATDLALALAPCREAGERGTRLPARVSLVELLRREGTDPLDAEAVATAWRSDDGSCRAPVAVGPAGPWCLDLDLDGPHALVAGTTGAGKSQLLSSCITALAVTHPPDALTFVLVDYKGGATFAQVAQLPHVTGLVTDLDHHLTRRLLDSLAAEIKRRERLLGACGAPDLAAYRRLRPADGEPLPRLVVVVDEFRVLVEELPDFVPGLVRLAAVGRSLGLHLVLATQRPAGVVSADIRANVNLRIALRVRDVTDSLDVVECADAAALPSDIPGRAMIAQASNPRELVQVATLLGGVGRGDGDRSPQVRRLSDTGSVCSPGRTGDPADEISCLTGVLTAVREAWRTTSGVEPRPPWLPALPSMISLRSLRKEAAEHAGRGVLTLGREDLVQLQTQPPWLWGPDEPGHLAIVGGPGSGRTTALRTVATAASITGTVVHALDSGGLADLESLPNVANAVPFTDAERCDRLLRGFERAGHPPALLLVDDWDTVQAVWSEPEFLPLLDRLTTRVRDAGGGIRVVAAGGRGLLTGITGSCFAQRVVLPLADPADAVLAGIPSSMAAELLTAPGRGARLVRGASTPVQFAVPMPQVPMPQVPVPQMPVPQVPGAPHPAGAPRKAHAWHVPALPTRIDLHRIDGGTAGRTAGRTAGGIVVGMSAGTGDESATLVPADLPVSRTGGSLILGRSGSGRSTVLDVLEQILTRQGREVVRVDPRSVTSAWAPRLAETPDAVALVDDAEALGPEAEELLTAHLNAGSDARAGLSTADRSGRPCLVAVSTAADVLHRYRGLLSELRAGRCGVVVGGAQPGDGEVFGVRLTPGRATLPGRGVLVERGRTTTVQLAVAGDPAMARQERT